MDEALLSFCCAGERARAAIPGEGEIGFRHIASDRPDALPDAPSEIVALRHVPTFATLVHEAAHAVVAHAFGWKVEWVSRIGCRVEYPINASMLQRATVNLAGVIGEGWLPPMRTFRPAPLETLERVGTHCANGVGGFCDHCSAFRHAGAHGDETGEGVIAAWRAAERLAFQIISDRWSAIHHLALAIEREGKIEGKHLLNLLENKD